MEKVVEHKERRTALMQKARETKKNGTENWVSYWVYLARKENKRLVGMKKPPVHPSQHF
jgi:hypothetical protein